MFSLHQIKDASNRVSSGTDFPVYIRELKNIGVTEYVTFVNDGHTVFFGEEDFSIQSEEKYGLLKVAKESSREKLLDYLREHQQGRSDLLTFCKHAADSGVARWAVDLNAMTCTYYDTSGEIILDEPIPVSTRS